MDQDPALLDFSDVLPPPIAVDLNGDGRVEVITASHDARLQVCAGAHVRISKTHVEGSGITLSVFRGA